MVMYILLGITLLYVCVVTYLYLTSELPDLPDLEEEGSE